MDLQSFNRHCETELHHHGVTVETHGMLLAIVRYGLQGDCGGGARSLTWEGERMVAVGVGPSALPSATPPIRTRERDVSTSYETVESKDTVEIDLALEPLWSSGSLEMKGKARGAGDEEPGTHVVVFP